MYVKKYFRRCQETDVGPVNNVQKAYAVRIDKWEWMSSTTKEKRKRLFMITKKIG
jgi:putative endopeptidase